MPDERQKKRPVLRPLELSSVPSQAAVRERALELALAGSQAWQWQCCLAEPMFAWNREPPSKWKSSVKSPSMPVE